MAKKINITAQLNAATTDGILADAGQIFDAKKGKFQEQVNEEFENALEETITSEDTDMVVESIEEGIVHNALRKTEQILTEAEKEQARENIGAVSEQTFENEAVRVKKQVFTSEQKYQARHNISAITSEEAEKIAQDKINETSVSSPDKLQAVKELSSWLEENPDNAATMNEKISENYADIQRLYRGTGLDEYSQFSTLSTYSAGDIVLYDGVLFRFKADHAAGEWDYNEVEEWSEKKEREELGQYEDNPEYARAYTDAEGRFLWGIKQDGSIEFAKGIPTPIKNYIVEFVFNRLTPLEEAHEQYLKESENPEWARVIVDAEGKVLWGIRHDGSVEFTKGIPSSIKAYIDSLDRKEEVERINQLVIGLLADVKVLTDTYHYVSNPEWACAIVDAEERILMGIKTDGSTYVSNREMLEKFNDIEGRTEMTLDEDGHILSYRDSKGVKHEMRSKLYDVEFGTKAKGQVRQVIRETENIEKGIRYKPKFGYVNIKSETFYLTADSRYSDKDGVVCIQVYDDTVDNAKESKILSYYYIKSTLNDVGGLYDRNSITDNSVRLSLYVAKDVANVNGGYYVKSTLTKKTNDEGDTVYEVNPSSINVTQITDVPQYKAWKVDKDVEHQCVADIDFGTYYNKKNVSVGIKFQGSGSLKLRKRGLRLTFYTNSKYEKKEKVKIGEMLRLSGYNMKSFFTSDARVIDPVLCGLFIQIWKTNGIDCFPWSKDSVPYNGATGMIESFPIETKLGNDYYGLQFFGLKKDEKNYMLDGDNDASGIFAQGVGYMPWTTVRAVNCTDEMMDEMSTETENALNAMFDSIKGFIEGSVSAPELEEYIDVKSWIDYWICLNVFQLWDNTFHNMIFYSAADKKKFYAFYYDLDNALQRSYNVNFLEFCKNSNHYYVDFWEAFINEYKDSVINRYYELRKSVLNVGNVEHIYRTYIEGIPQDVIDNEIETWGSGSVSSFETLLGVLEKRLYWLDSNNFNL